ncbi:hypothetical protein BDB01DRAFT_903525 [Pilobolus umbonatus]|nr:hypothetical protein BDB01DRAFT_903525 [Pilobolus umbonatus]
MAKICWDAFDMTKSGLPSFTSMEDEESPVRFSVPLSSDGISQDFQNPICCRSLVQEKFHCSVLKCFISVFNNKSELYDHELKFNKLKLPTYFKKLIESGRRLAPLKQNERNRPVVVVFGAQFGYLCGDVPALSKILGDDLNRMAREHNKHVPTFVVLVDECLTSQICYQMSK